MLVIPIEATAAATILNAWFPGVATWVFALGITLVLTVTNLFSVKNYGEFEFWFALIKVVAIVVFLHRRCGDRRHHPGAGCVGRVEPVRA